MVVRRYLGSLLAWIPLNRFLRSRENRCIFNELGREKFLGQKSHWYFGPELGGAAPPAMGRGAVGVLDPEGPVLLGEMSLDSASDIRRALSARISIPRMASRSGVSKRS